MEQEHPIYRAKSANTDALRSSLYDWACKFWNPLPIVWPTVEEIQRDIKVRPEYQQLELIAPLPHDGILKSLTRTICSTIENKWMETKYHKPYPSIDVLLDEYCEITVQVDEPYRHIDDLMKEFYSELEHRICQQLYYSNQVYSIEELERVYIPHVDSPFYCRESIMLNYMQPIQQLKDRGEEWRAKIIQLQYENRKLKRMG